MYIIAFALTVTLYYTAWKNKVPFFNRSEEVNDLVHQVTKSHLGLTIVTGLPDSGKIAVLKKQTTNSCRWFHMDIRQPENS